MVTGVSYQVVKDFYNAFASRDPLRVAAFLTDDVQWHMAGPVDIFHFCGYRRGKAAVMDYLTRLVPQVFSIRRFEPTELVIDGNRAGVFSHVHAVQKNTGRVITFHGAHFVVFKDDKVVSMQGVTDTFDVVEQIVGHRIDPYQESQAPSASDIVAI